VKLPTDNTPVPSEIADEPKCKWFKRALGAVDGTKLNVVPPSDRRNAFRTYHGELQQNVLAVVSFDLRFYYLLCGWEGSAGDARVMDDARSRSLKVPDGKYYLGDAAFSGSDVCITPYPKTAYHVQEYVRRGAR
jgi:hypothetical protein